MKVTTAAPPVRSLRRGGGDVMLRKVENWISHPRLACTVGAVVAAMAGTTAAQRYPDRPVRVIVPSQAGGGADIVARAIAQKLAETWGQPVVVDNRIGVAGAETAARAVPDGYTVMFTTSALVARES